MSLTDSEKEIIVNIAMDMDAVEVTSSLVPLQFTPEMKASLANSLRAPILNYNELFKKLITEKEITKEVTKEEVSDPIDSRFDILDFDLETINMGIEHQKEFHGGSNMEYGSIDDNLVTSYLLKIKQELEI